MPEDVHLEVQASFTQPTNQPELRGAWKALMPPPPQGSVLTKQPALK